MICVNCERPTTDESVCEHCGLAPLVDGRYRLLARLGQGANATTYKAERVDDGRIVALKELLVRRAQSLKAMELFDREATFLRQLDHPDIPSYIEDFCVETGPNVGMYLAQEFEPGESLAAMLVRRGALEPRRVIEIVRQVAQILAYLHGLSPPVVHRDIKPANLIWHNGRIALIDFGSVRDVLGDGAADGIPTMAGTVGYMGPEQLRGTATAASDIYALGMTAVTLLTARTPLENVEQRWSADVPAEVHTAIGAMLALAPENRPVAAGDGPRSLESLLDAADRALDAAEERAEQRQKALAEIGEPPRPLPDDFVAPTYGRTPAALTAGFGAMLGGIFAIPGFVIAGVATVAVCSTASALLLRRVARARSHVDLYTHGMVTIGRVIGASSNPFQHTRDPRDDGESKDSTTGVVYFEFVAGGERLAGVAHHTTTLDPRAGSDVLVFYEPANPTHHAILPEFLSTPRLM